MDRSEQLADALERADAELRAAEVAHVEADEVLAREHAAEAVANSRFDLTGEEGDLAEASKAQLRRARAERVAVTRREAVNSARAALTAAQRDVQRALYERATARLDVWEGTLRDEVEELVVLDRQLADVVDAVAGRVVEAEELFAEARELAGALGLDREFSARHRAPTLATAQFVARVGLRVAREQEGRTSDLDDWMNGDVKPGIKDSPVAWDHAVRVLPAWEVEDLIAADLARESAEEQTDAA